MCEGELATVSRAVRFAYDVLKGSVRARRGKLTMGGCLKPLEDRKRQTSETMDKFNLLKRFPRLCQTAKLTIYRSQSLPRPSPRTAAPEHRKESAEVVWASGQDAFLRRFSGLDQLGGDLGEGPGPGGEIISPLWPGSTGGEDCGYVSIR